MKVGQASCLSAGEWRFD